MHIQLCDPIDCTPDYSVHGILQRRTMESVAIPFSRRSTQARDWTWASRIASRFFTIWGTREAPCSFLDSFKLFRTLRGKVKVKVKIPQSCLTVCDPMDCSLPGSFVNEILQAKILEWVPLPLLGDLLDPGIEPKSPVSPVLAGEFFTTEPPGKPQG